MALPPLKSGKHAATLNLALFATGLSGIVSEYVLATMATYFIGNSVVQWTVTLSIMLFSMGLGSRLSQFIEWRILEKFILIEFTLTLLVSFCAILTYSTASVTTFTQPILYGLSVVIGLLIGMEIPLVVRINESFASLRVNISGAMEKDYYGALAGGVIFLVGLPFLKLTYMPFLLGSINFLVACWLIYRLKPLIAASWKLPIMGVAVLTLVAMLVGATFAEPVIMYSQQKRYKDKVIYEKQSRYQMIVVTEWKGDHWLFLNGYQQLSTWDEFLYHEPLVHPAMKLAGVPKDVLILGGGDGCAAREVLKYPTVENVTLVDLDPAVTELCSTHEVFVSLNDSSLTDPRTTVINADAFTFMEKDASYYDVIIADFPDPKSVEISRLYSLELYRLCYRHLRPNGVICVQSGSPYYTPLSFRCIEKSLRSAGFSVQPMHNQVITFGEWGFNLGVKGLEEKRLRPVLQDLDFSDLHTRWINQEAMSLITSFGKEIVPFDTTNLQINSIQNPVLPSYYRNGRWDLYH